MKKLNVICMSCNNGKLTINEYFENSHSIGCDGCNRAFWASPTAYKALVAESNHNDAEEDVDVLNDNGYWSFVTEYKKDFDLDEHTKGMTKIHTIKENLERSYYHLDGQFFRFATYHDGATTMHHLKPNGVGEFSNIINHFFTFKSNPLYTKQTQTL